MCRIVSRQKTRPNEKRLLKVALSRGTDTVEAASTHTPLCPLALSLFATKRPPVQGQAWKSAASTFHSQKSRPPDTDRVCGVGGCTQTDRVRTTWHTRACKALEAL